VREVPVTTKAKVSLSNPDVAPTRKVTKPLPVFWSARKRQLIEQLAAEVQSPAKVLKTTATAVRPALTISTSTSASPVFFASPTTSPQVTAATGIRMTPSPRKRSMGTQTPWIMEASANIVVHHHVRKVVKTYFEEGAQMEETIEDSWDD